MVVEEIGNALQAGIVIIDSAIKNVLPLRHPSVLIGFIILSIIAAIAINKTFVRFPNKEELQEHNRSRRWIRIFTTLTRATIFLLLLTAMASPFMSREEVVEGDLSISILADNSSSFELFNSTIAETLKSQLELAFPATLKYIAQGDRSPIADGVIASLKGNDHLLLISDGNTNHGRPLKEIVMFLANMNSTISILDLQPVKDDTGVVIRGLDKVVRGTEAPISVKVTQIGKETPYHIKVKVGTKVEIDEDIIGSKSYDISRRLGEGYHKVSAELTVEGDDNFADNNVYYKTVEVLKRPKVLVVSKKESYFYDLLMDIYDFARQDSLPDDLSDYTAVILNDIPMSDISLQQYERLSDFVINGSGLVVYGGQSSYDSGAYANSPIETLLPVKTGSSEKEDVKKEDVNIVLLIDVSGSTGGMFSGAEGDKKVDVEKALALSVLDNIKGNSKVGAIAFNTGAYVVSDLVPLNQNADLRDRISRLMEGGGTDIAVGIRDAEFMLAKVKGSNNIILISDGITVSPGEALAETEKAKRKGITTYTVGVGGDTFEQLLKQMASAGKGSYFRPAQSQRLKIIFGEPEEDEQCNEEKRKLALVNPNHFITEGLEIDASVTGYNFAAPKPTSIPLVATCNGKAILTVWRYGLGRVAAMSTDDGSKWSGQLMSAKNSEIITRMINWAIGDPSRREDFRVKAKDTNLGEPVRITVRSKSVPSNPLVNFTKIAEDTYEGDFIPTTAGYYDFLGAIVGVSYPLELEKTGINPEMINLAYATGGEVFDPGDIEGIINKTKALSRRIETEETDVTWPFLLAALVLFMIEILIRRVWESSRG